MNLSWLEDFQALAASGNFSRAAEQRHMTQPAFGRRIKALEEWLGVSLFDRSGHPVSLTETGQWFVSVAQDILQRVARVPEEARAVADASAASLRFAATHALSLTFLPTWLRSLESIAPIGPIQLVSDVALHCEALMQQGRAQFLLCHAHADVPGRLDPEGFNSVRVGTDTLLPVCAPDAAGKPRYLLSHTRKTAVPLLAFSAESGLGRIVRALRGEALDKAHAEPVCTAHLATFLKSMALEGRGVAWLPLSLIEDELREGRLVHASQRSWWVEVEIHLFRRTSAEPAAAEAFWRVASGSQHKNNGAHDGL
nr:LysR family transcriptional regulator [uncultured Albidiferax sp.]